MQPRLLGARSLRYRSLRSGRGVLIFVRFAHLGVGVWRGLTLLRSLLGFYFASLVIGLFARAMGTGQWQRLVDAAALSPGTWARAELWLQCTDPPVVLLLLTMLALFVGKSAAKPLSSLGKKQQACFIRWGKCWELRCFIPKN